MTDRLDVVSVRIANECPEVSFVVLGEQAGFVENFGSRGHGGVAEFSDLFPIGGFEGHVHLPGLTAGRHRPDPELGTATSSETYGVAEVQHALVAQGGENRVVKPSARLDIGDLKRQVIEHIPLLSLSGRALPNPYHDGPGSPMRARQSLGAVPAGGRVDIISWVQDNSLLVKAGVQRSERMEAHRGRAAAWARPRGRLSRRALLRSTGAGLGGLALSPLLAACGIGSQAPTAKERPPRGVFDEPKSGILRFANWPYYMDTARVNGKSVHPSLERFRRATGIQVEYREVIEDYASFFARLEPELRSGEDTGWDLVVIGYPKWVPLMIRLGYLTPLDHSHLRNFHKYAAAKYKDPSYDPGNRYTIPWQSGITGIGYDPNLTGREITSVMDLFDPAFKGRVGMFGDTEDLPNLTLLGLGIEPSSSTPDDWQKAADLLMRQRDSGIVRQYFGQSYIGALQRGDVALTMAWSADVFISNNSGHPNLKFVVPDEGALLWTDHLCIPRRAQHPVDAITYMDFVYRPEIAALLTAWVQTVSPVPKAQSVLVERGDKKVAHSQLVFPTPDVYERLHNYRILKPEEEETWNTLFQPIFQS